MLRFYKETYFLFSIIYVYRVIQISILVIYEPLTNFFVKLWTAKVLLYEGFKIDFMWCIFLIPVT